MVGPWFPGVGLVIYNKTLALDKFPFFFYELITFLAGCCIRGGDGARLPGFGFMGNNYIQ